MRWSAVLALALALSSPSVTLGLEWDGTNPGATACGNGTNPVYTLGKRTAASPLGSQGIPTPIYAGATKIGEVEIRHSAFCATVWSRVKNLTSTTVTAQEIILIYADSNGNGEQAFGETDTLAPGQTGWSKQYRDRASFVAKGGIFYNGSWRWAQTARSVAWAPFQSAFANIPYACQHTATWPCNRWPKNADGTRRTFKYYMEGVSAMPNGSGGTVNVSGDITFMVGKFNAVAAASPIFNLTNLEQDAKLFVYSYFEANIVARGGSYDRDGDFDYDDGEIKLSTAVSWGNSNNNRSALCHEIDHVMGLNHVWGYGNDGIDNVGSKATCIGNSYPTGPSIDDVSALSAVYAGALP